MNCEIPTIEGASTSASPVEDGLSLIRKFHKKPNAYWMGKFHEKWVSHLFQREPHSYLVQNWMKTLVSNEARPNILFTHLNPQNLIEQPIVFINRKTFKNGFDEALVEGILPRGGATKDFSHLFSASMDKVIEETGFIPSVSECPTTFFAHYLWLKENTQLSETHLNPELFLKFYQEQWHTILSHLFFGNLPKDTSKNTAVIISDLSYDLKSKELLVTRSALVTIEQFLKDLSFISPVDQIQLNLKEHGEVVSGVFSIGREGGKHLSNTAHYWKVRYNRKSYLNYIEKNRPETIWKPSS